MKPMPSKVVFEHPARPLSGCRWALAVVAVILTSGTTTPCRSQPAGESSWNSPTPLARVARAFATHSREELSLSGLCDRLAEFDAVFLGETHTDETTHRVELAIYEGLIERLQGRVVLSMEMFDRDAQSALDRYTRGEIEEAEFLRLVPTWSNYPTDYRPLVEAARSRGLPVIGSNLPASLRRTLAFGGKAAWEELPPEARARLPEELFPNSDAYWARFERAVRGHAGMLSGGEDPEARLYSIQSLWDNVMGWSCAKALEDRPGWRVLHVAGAFHTSYRDGTVEQFRRRRPESRIATVDIAATGDLPLAGLDLDTDVADFVVYADSRATSLHDGFYSVATTRELEYRLHVPADRSEPLPLLLWLHDDGLDSEAALDYWRLALGAQAILAILETPYPEVEEDLHRSGRWFARSFASDVSWLGGGIHRITHYLSQHFPVDPEHIVVAGEGTGAAVVAAVALHRGETPLRCVAVGPRRYTELRDLSLPDPQKVRVRATTSSADLHLLVRDADRVWWTEELTEYGKVGISAHLASLGDEGSALDQAEGLLRRELGIGALEPAAGAPEVWEVHHSGALPLHWAQRLARGRRAQGVPVTLRVVGTEASGTETSGSEASEGRPVATRVLGFRSEIRTPAGSPTRETDARRFLGPEDFATGHALPMAPGAFGGTTIVVVPAGVESEERARWRQLESDDVLKKRSRFCSLEVAFADEERTLAVVLAEVEKAGRTNVLIVPAAFYAPPESMRALRDEHAAPFLSRLRISWQPGLGAELAH